MTTSEATTTNNEPATRGQHWALFCATGLDTRVSTVTQQQAGIVLDVLKDAREANDTETLAQAIVVLKSYGATGNGRTEYAKAKAKKPAKVNGKKPAKISAKAKAKRENARDRVHRSIYNAAHHAGLEAGRAVNPTPMVVQQHRNVLDDDSPVVKTWHAPEGVCGFAWVVVRPGTSSFARWVRRAGLGESSDYYRGTYLKNGDGGREFGQSYERKHAYAAAFCKVLREHGINAQAYGKED